jgi:pyruvate dehydrogenase (quinone)
MAVTAADVLIETLLGWGVDVVFGLPGDGINGIMEALRTRQDRIRFVQVRHEEAAAFMACGYAKFTGRLGVCLATSGPGGIHLLNGLYDAALDGQPVLAITGMTYHDLIGTSSWMWPSSTSASWDRRTSRTSPTWPAGPRSPIAGWPTSRSRGAPRSPRNVEHHTSDTLGRSAGLPDEGRLRRAAELLNAGRRVAILAGRGALHAGDELEAVADRLAAPIVKALLGKAAVPDDSRTRPVASACSARGCRRRRWRGATPS